jgi:Mn2+/Fe2+ NRAMP family transporter
MDVWAGTLFAMLTVFFIIVSTATTLHPQGVHISTAAEAARALEPLAGNYARYLFGVGLFGASMLAAGVLPLATAYSISEALGFEKGVSRSFREAPIFIGIFTFLVVVGALVALLAGRERQISVLLVTQVINGLLLPVVLIAVLRLVNNKEIMGEHVNGLFFNIAAWLTALVVSALSITLIVMQFVP